MTALTLHSVPQIETEFDSTISGLHYWLLARDYAGHEPYDLLNSPWLAPWARHQPFATLFIQSGKRIGGLALRRLLRVPASRNPKGLALVLAAYCDLARTGWNCRGLADRVQQMLIDLRSPRETEFCWGYDWHYVSVRGARMPAFTPNSVVTVFCAQALLDHEETFHDGRTQEIALSAADWLSTRLQRPADDVRQLCFSYTPHDRTKIFNNSVLVGALLARIACQTGDEQYRVTARRTMQYLADGQSDDGSWPYGAARSQQWIDSFHTGYNLCALLDYQAATGDGSFAAALGSGYGFYTQHFFRADGAPRYFHNRTLPIDIHACSQAILTFCAFAHLDPDALRRAVAVARWTIANLMNTDGSFGYQIHRYWTDRTPYIRWSQAWMLRALARLRLQLQGGAA